MYSNSLSALIWILMPLSRLQKKPTGTKLPPPILSPRT